jgi:hypothetical protein
MQWNRLVFGEQSLSRVCAVYGSESLATDAARRLRDESSLDDDQVEIVRPEDFGGGRHRAAEKLEPEDHGIAHTLWRSHLTLGLAGGVSGLLIGLLLIEAADLPMFSTSPTLTTVVLFVVGALVGMLLAGALSLRPDRDPVTFKTLKAARNGKWTVVVRPDNEGEKRTAQQLLDASPTEHTQASL